VCGVLPSPDGPNFVVNIIRNMVNSDKEGTQCLIPILSFCRGSGDDFMGMISRNISNYVDQYGATLTRSNVFSFDKKALFRTIVKEYYSSVVRTLIKV
jgi:hypothetical protein